MDFLNLELFEEIDAQQASTISGGVTGIQVQGGTIDTGSGDDQVAGIVSAQPLPGGSVGISVLLDGSIVTGSGNDTVIGTQIV